MGAWCVVQRHSPHHLTSRLKYDHSSFQDTLTSTLEDYGSPLVGGYSAMAKLVGIPCGIAVQFVIDGKISTPGVQAPYSEELCTSLREAVEAEGITMIERVL